VDTPIRNTINYLRRCQDARDRGIPVYLQTDPSWLVNVAINRRAGWPESRDYFASCMPVNGHYPPKADWHHSSMCQLIDRINTPRLRVDERELPGQWKQRLSHRVWAD